MIDMRRKNKAFHTLRIIAVTSLMGIAVAACGDKTAEQAANEVVFEEIGNTSETAEPETVYEEPEEPEIMEEPVEPEESAEADGQEETDSSENGTDPAEAGDGTEQDEPVSPDTPTEKNTESDSSVESSADTDAGVPDVVTVSDEPDAGQPAPEEPQSPAQPSANDRILFIGDSRTIDMFADSDDTISGAVVDGITVYAAHGRGYEYMTGVINGCGIDSFDTLVTWMGANDAGDFSRYAGYYEGILAAGKRLVLCTVGPTDNNTLAEWDHPDYENENMVRYNGSLVSWAQQHGVCVIDLYSYIAANVQIDTADGIHYLPRPTGSIWAQILSHKNRDF